MLPWAGIGLLRRNPPIFDQRTYDLDEVSVAIGIAGLYRNADAGSPDPAAVEVRPS
jgi:hypothetical protein